MATKARFFEVVIKDVHNTRHEAFAAQSEADLRNKLDIHPLELLVSLSHLGFYPVEADPDEENNSVVFSAQLPSGAWFCYVGGLSHPYLMQQFSATVGNINEYFRQRDEARYQQ
ncbi:hypothetical protein K5D32_02770 [Pseudomonas cichorii]|uniref:hypothetical protein n=1 Tax=Pseudomonas cichorii TaxID=36746 RepID=UPI001C89E5EE|nr:hypothetical protein [Pseudomonas cichorii]MBX8528567.1 hypothetical protein [Pseudomonas cichorii]